MVRYLTSSLALSTLAIARPFHSLLRSRDGDWTTIHCDSPWMADASQDQTDRWNGVSANDAWNDAVNAYHTKSGGLTFSEALSNFFHGPEGIQCASTADHNGCDGVGSMVCDTFQNTGAASYFIMQSITAVEAGILNFYDAIGRSEEAIASDISQFTSDFAPVPSESDGLKIALDLLSLGFSLAVAPMWNSWLKGFPFFKENGNVLGTLKDSANPIVTNSLTLIKDGSTGAVLNEQNDFAHTLAQLTTEWYHAIDIMNQNLFNGSEASIGTLFNMITDGKFLEQGPIVSDLDIQSFLQKAIYSVLIPEAWGMTQTYPFILDSGTPCGTVDPIDVGVLDHDTAQVTWACAQGKLYYLVAAGGESENCGGGDGEGIGCTPNTFWEPSGLDKLDGTTYGGLTLNDLVNGAVNSFTANGNSNGGPLADPNNVDTLQDIYANGPQAAGVINIPVCGADEANNNWASYTPNNDGGKSAHYPCN